MADRSEQDARLLREMGARIRRIRTARRLRQSDLCKAAEISSVMTISKIERGAWSPGITLLSRIAAALGVSVDTLTTGRGIDQVPGIRGPQPGKVRPRKAGKSAA